MLLISCVVRDYLDRPDRRPLAQDVTSGPPPARLVGAQNAQNRTASIVIGTELKSAQIGGYRVSSGAQRKLQRVTRGR